MKKNSIGKTLRRLAVLTALICIALVGWSTAENDGQIVYADEVQVVSSAQGISNKEAAEGFIRMQMRTSIPEDSLSKATGSAGRRKLTSTYDQHFYDGLRTQVLKVVNGEVSSTVFTIPYVDIYGSDKICFTPNELVPGTTTVNQAVKDAFNERVGINLDKIIDALLVDCPYELFWYDKSCGISNSSYAIRTYSNGTQEIYLPGEAYTVSMRVAKEYAVSGETHVFNTQYYGQVSAAVARAEAILDRYSGQSDIGKLNAYKNEICALTDYNRAAADEGAPYGNPWQMIWVFDGDPETKVVCEGYSKAFQYLCDNSSLSSVSTLLVTGQMGEAGKSSGGHMWNIVRLADGKNYMADVTNSDSGSIGQNGGLFLAGYSSVQNQSGNRIYVYEVDQNNIAYYYFDNDSIGLYGTDALALAPRNEMYSGNYNTTVSWTLHSDGLLRIFGYGSMEDKNSMPWSEYSEEIFAVEITSGVTRIPASAFKDCLYLADVSIPSTVTQIGDYAFKGCSALTSMALPANMTVFGQGVFSQSGLTSIPDHLNTTIPPAGFQSCNGLANITVPTGVATISGSAFKDCSNLQTISLPASVTSIESEAFRECVNLREITIPNSVTSIESNAFLNCSELEGVYFLGTESEWETLRNAAIQAGGNNALANATVHCLPGGQCGENCFWKLEDDGTLYITGTGAMYNYDIIGTTGLQSPFYAHKDRICSIVMGEGVTQIGNWAFYQLDQVSAVSLPGSLTIIGRQAFAECEGITEIVIPDHVTSIGNQAFFECTSLETVDLPASLTRLEGSFEGCSQLKNITIPANTTTIYGSAFKGCKNLESMILPEGLTTLELGIFQNCTGLKSVTLPTTVTTIQKGAFAACSALTDVYYGGTNATRQSITVQADNDLLEHPTVTWHYANGNGGSCGEKAWWHLYDNQRLVITGTGSIYDYKAEDFYRAPWYSVRSNIQSIEVEEGITNIGTYAFADCENVTGVSLPEDLLIIKEAAFSGCRRMNPVIIPDTVTSIGDQAFQDCYALTTMIIPESVYTIGDYAFADCNNLQTVSVPGTIARIGTNAFSSCEALTSVYFCGTEAQWRNLRCTSVTESMVKYHSLQKNERQPATSTANGFEEHWECIYCHKLYLDAEGTNRTTVADLTILATGQKCGESLFWAFDEATYILTISGTGEMYDYNDQSLAPWAGIREQITTVVIESGATTIGEFAFSGCGAITGITMPTTLTVIGDYAFENCSKLTAVVIPSGMTTLGEGAFTGCSTLNSVTLPNSVTGIGIHAFSECPALTQIQIPASVESIGGYAFALSGLKAITIPSGVTSIGEYAFSRCGDLESAVINANITGIPEGLFNQCDELTSVTIPNTVTSIGDSAFEETSLTDITTLLTYVTSIGSDAFRSCQQLESVVIPSGVQTIGKNAFNSCSNLESVSIPGTVTSMGGKDPLNQNDKNHVFDQCIKLTEICFCGTEAQWTALNTALPNQTTQLRYHNYGTASYTWAEDNSTVTASHTCEYCSAVETEEAITTSEETTPATCEDTGVRTYTAAFENTAFTTQTKTVTIAALDHAYGDAIYTWADENGTCTATRTCTRDNCSGTETETVNATSEVTKAATCTAKGETTYTATFTNTAFETQTKTAEISALGHTPGTAVQENRVESTCTAAGSYDEVIKCVTCGHVISSEKKMLPLAAHTPEHHPAVSHSCYVDGNKEYWQCTACGKYFQEEQATNEITQAQTVDPARHTLEYRAAQASSCTWQGNVEHWICTVCKTCFSDQAGTQIIADVKLPALNHPDTEIRTGARTEPTCIASGGYYQYIYCNTCQNIIDSTWIDLDPLGHDFGDPVYVWSADHSTCTATRTCTRDNCTGKETQEGTVSSKQTKEPTCTEKGETTYTAVFENTAFETQTETVSNIDARGHDLIHHDAKAPTCTEVGWDAYDTCSRCDYTTYAEKDALGHDLKPVAEVPATCTTDGTEAYWKCDRCDLLFSDAEGKNRIDEPVVISAAHVLVHHDAQAPTCTEIGWDAYDTCSRCDYTTYVEKAALGHDYVDHAAQAPTCTEIGWDAYKTCSRCDYTTYVQKDALDHDYVDHEAKAPTCTEIGWNAYQTCSRCDYTSYAEISALGHDWKAEYTWADDGSQCTVVCVCQRVTDHQHTETVDTTSAVSTQPTCEGKGKTTYTAVFTVEGAEQQAMTLENIDALGHDWGDIRYTWSADNKTVTAAKVCKRDQSHLQDAETVSVTARVTRAATCTAQGQTTYTSAAFQNAQYTVQTKTLTNIPAQGHKLTAHARVAPTYEKTGTEAYWECTSCHKLFSDSAATKEISAPVVIAKLTPAEPPEPADKVEAFVTRCYRVILGREPDAGGLAYWVESLKSGKEKASEIINGFVTSNEFVNRHYSDDTAVEILYKAMLGRGSDAGGKNYWLSILSGGNPFAAVINGFCTSTEFKNLCAAYGIEPGSVKTDPLKPPKPVKDMTKIRAFVTRCYKVILSRTPDDTGLEYWAKALANGDEEAAGIIDGFVNSHEYTNKHLGYADSVEVLYNAMLGRGSDEGGKAYWVEQLQNGRPFAAIINGFCTSKEFKALCEQYGISPGSVKGVDKVGGVIATGPDVGAIAVKHLNEEKVRAFIARVYRVLLEREATEDEIVFWAGSVLTDRMTVAKALHDIVLSREFADKVPDNAELIRRLYLAYTGRNPGGEEAAAWVARLEAGEPLENIANGFAASKEFKNIVSSMME